jgi:hypothetical protein
MKKPLAISVSAAMSSPKLLGPFFGGESWTTWRAVIKAMFAEKMSETEIASFREVAERDPPKQRVAEATIIVGRGGGKDSVASAIVTTIAVNFDPRGKLRPGERAVVMAIAVDRDQAAIVTNYIKGYFEQVPALAKMVKSIDRDGIALRNGVTIVVATNNYRSVRGRSILAAVFDEVAFWRSEDSATPDFEVAGAVAPGLARIPGSMMILISSAHKRSGLLYQKWKDHYGRNADDVLVVRGTTLQFNPTFDAKTIARQIEEDPQLYGAEYNSQWRDDLATFIGRELLEAAIDRGVLVRSPIAGTNYFAFADPSGGAHDSFTMAISHREKDGSVVLDLLFERKAPFNPTQVTSEIAAMIKSYRCTQVVGDRYAAQWVVEAFAKVGIKYVQSERDRSEIYLDCLPLFTAGRARLIENARMVAQFAALERRTFSTGKDRVDHGRAGHDDVCNSAAGALVLAASGKAQMIVSSNVLQRASMPTNYAHKYPDSARRSRRMNVFW